METIGKLNICFVIIKTQLGKPLHKYKVCVYIYIYSHFKYLHVGFIRNDYFNKKKNENIFIKKKAKKYGALNFQV